jgi:hypothetical protein
VPVSTETKTTLGMGLGVSNSLSPRATGLSTYGLGGYLIYSNMELGRIPQVPWLLPTLLSSLGLGLR